MEGNEEFGVERETEIAIGCLERASEMGCAKSRYIMGLLLREGAVIKKDERRSSEYIKKAAKKIPEANFMDFVEKIKREIKVIDLYHCKKMKEENLNFFPASVLFSVLSCCYLKRNDIDFFVWKPVLLRAFIDNHPPSLYSLALFFEDFIHPLDPHLKNKLYSLAAQLSHPKSLYNYAYILWKGTFFF